MTPQPPPGQGPIDPRGAFAPPPSPGQSSSPAPTESVPRFNPPPGWSTPVQRPRKKLSVLLSSIVTSVTLVLFVGSLLLNGYFLATKNSDDDDSISRKTLVPGDSKQVIAVVPIVTALMTDGTAEKFDSVMKEVDGDSDVKAVVLRIDTPGGEVTAADEIYHRVQTYKTKHPNVPVVVSMGGMATSGGYYAACAGDWLVAEPTTLTGNIGVLLPQYNLAKLADKYGVEDDTIHNQGADFKTAGSMLRTPTTQETDYLKHLIDQDAAQFHSVVIKGRQGRLLRPQSDLFNGQAFGSSDALAAGLVDEVGMADAAYKVAASKAGLSSMKVVRYDTAEPFLRSLISSSTGVHRPTGQSISIGGVQIESAVVDSWMSGRPLYYHSTLFR